MKKLVTALLVVVMMLSLCTAAFAFSDTTDLSKDAQASVAKLSGLNIINGYPDGTFKPANNITRAEFAKIAAIMGGMGNSADVLKSSTSKFTDVKAGEWYTGFVNLANSQGWVKGFPDGTFRPNAQITYAEVITVLVRLAGYNDNLPGPWPVDYIAKAGALDITSGVAFDANSPATRGDVSLMGNNTLDCDVVKWDADVADFVGKYGTKDADQVSMLDDNFDSAVNEDYFIVSTNCDDEVWSIKVRNMSPEEGDLVYKANDDAFTKTFDLAAGVVVSDGSLNTGLNGKIVDFTYNDDDEEISFIEVQSTNVTVKSSDWSVDKLDNAGVVTRYEIDGKKYDVASTFIDADGKAATPVKTFEANKYYRAFLNDDGEVFRVATRPSGTPALVDEYKAATEKLTFKYAGNQKSSYDFTDKTVLIEKGGKFVTLADLQENDVIYVSEEPYSDYDYYLEVYALSTEGKVTSFYDGAPAKIKVDDTKYDVAATSKMSLNDGEDVDEDITEGNLEDVYDTTVKYFLNKDKEISYIISNADGSASEESTIYGVVTDIVSKNSVNNKVNEITVVKKDGTEANYKINTTDVELLYPEPVSGKNQINIDDFIKFKVNSDNEIDSLTFLAKWTDANKLEAPSAANCYMTAAVLADYADPDNAKYVKQLQSGDSDDTRIKFDGDWYYLTDASYSFNGFYTEDGDDMEADAESNADIADWADATAFAAVDAYVQYDGGDVEYLYVHSDVGAASADYAAVLDNYFVKGDRWVKVDIAGEAKSYELKDATAPKVGAVYEYSISGSKFDYGTETFNPDDKTVVEDAYAAVTDINADKKSIEVGNTWYFANEDTVIYDFSDWYDNGDDPVYVTEFAGINEDDNVMVELSDDATDKAKGIVKTIWILNNVEDYTDWDI